MVLKKQYSFRWHLFVPIVAMLWGTVLFLMWFQYHRESEYRRDNLERQLGMFNSRIMLAYDSNYDMESVMKTLHMFFDDSRYEGIRVSVFRAEDLKIGGQPIYYMGKPLPGNVFKDFPLRSVVTDEMESNYDDDTLFYYKGSKSNDGDIYVFTAMPKTAAVVNLLEAGDTTFWIVLILLLLGATGVTFWLTTNISRNIVMLHEFAMQANNDTVRFDETQFPHNELGDISREIIRLYRERGEALEKSRKEHEVAIHAIEEKARIKRQLTNNINHELKTPVGVIKGYLDTVLSSDDMDHETRMYFLRRAQENVDRLCNLLNDVSTMTRLEEGSSNIPLTAIDFHDLVYSIDNDFTAAGMTGGMTFEFDIPLDCEILGNTNLLTSAITNLMKNAVIHSHGTKMGLRMVAQSEKYYTFSFWDDGQGVDATHIPHLFDRFFRVDAGRSRKSGGTGLGLPIVKNIIESLGGSLSVHTRSIGGLEFIFTLKKFN